MSDGVCADILIGLLYCRGFRLDCLCSYLDRGCCGFQVILNRSEGLHDSVVVWGIFNLAEHDAHGRDHGLHQRGGDRLLLCGFDMQEGLLDVFAEVRSMLTEVARPCSGFGPRGCHDAYIALGYAHELNLSN